MRGREGNRTRLVTASRSACYRQKKRRCGRPSGLVDVLVPAYVARPRQALPLSRYKEGTGQASAEYRGSHADLCENRQAPLLGARTMFSFVNVVSLLLSNVPSSAF